MYAYHMAKFLKNKPKLRVLSLGTGQKPFAKQTAKLDKSILLTSKDEFMLNIDVISSDYFLRNQFKYVDKTPEFYVRAQTESKYGLDSAALADLNGMQMEGWALWDKE